MVLHSQGSLPGRHVRSKFQLWMGGGEGEQLRQCNISWRSNKSWTSLRIYFCCRRHKGKRPFWRRMVHTMTKNAHLLMIWTKCNEIFGIFYRRAPLWCNLKEKCFNFIFKLLFHRWDGGDGCWSPFMLWAWLVHELCDKSCWNACTIVLFVNIASLIVQQCTCTYVGDQCELDNLVIQMGSRKEA